MTEEEFTSSSTDGDKETDVVDIDVIPLAENILDNGPNGINVDDYNANSVKYKGNPGPQPSLLVDSSPLNLFEAFVTNELVDLIVEQSVVKIMNLNVDLEFRNGYH